MKLLFALTMEGKMKKFLVSLFGVLLVFGMIGSAGATMVSFLAEDAYTGVDNPSSFSTNDAAVNLGVSSFSILGGLGVVQSSGGLMPTNLTSRGTRGLGVESGEFNEIDSINGAELITVTFAQRVFMNSITLRSLFANEGSAGEPEVAKINFFYWIDGKWQAPDPSVFALGVELAGADGEVLVAINREVEQIRLRVPPATDKYYPVAAAYSEFALASLDVVPVPEPATMFLLGSGLIGIGAFVRRRFKK